MKAITRQEFSDYIEVSTVKPRLRRELRFVPEEISDWQDRDFLTVTNRSGSEGVLLMESDSMQVVPFRLQPRKPNQKGRVEAVICDLCATWQRGTHSAAITFPRGDGSSLTLLCCGDLDCSLHVRGKTQAATLSRTQLREDISAEGRVMRLQERVTAVLDRI